jgi:hypothetical protein
MVKQTITEEEMMEAGVVTTEVEMVEDGEEMAVEMEVAVAVTVEVVVMVVVEVTDK